MREREYVLRHFESRLSWAKDQRILLCGTETYSRQIYNAFHTKFRFVGFVSPDGTCRERKLFGVPVILPDRVSSKNADLVLLSEHKLTGEPDYVRIAPVCVREGLPLYDMYGIDELKVHLELEHSGYVSPPLWLRKTKGRDVITICAMDTLFWIDRSDSENEKLVPFEEIIGLIRFFEKNGKTVVYVSRNIVTREELEEALIRTGLAKDTEDLKKRLFFRRGEDLGFRTIQSLYPGQKLFHIGSSVWNDGIIPRFYGIDTYLNPKLEFRLPEVKPPEEDPHTFRNIHGKGETDRIPDRDQILAKIDAAEMVSFDVFDTLLERLVPRPNDVFPYAAEDLPWPDYKRKTFVEKRNQVSLEHPEYDFDHLYDWVAAEMNLCPEERDLAKQSEWEAEKHLVVPREPVKDLLNYAIEKEKQIVFVSDMYLSSCKIRELMHIAGIPDCGDIYVSCENNAGKRNGLFERIAALGVPREKILHIGDDRESDCVSASRSGFESLRVPSAYDSAFSIHAWNALLRQKRSVGESLILGSVLHRVFSHPFRAKNYSDLSLEDRLGRYAVSAASPILLGYLLSIHTRYSVNDYDRILFSSRDGWLPLKIYNKIRELSEYPTIPGSYFYTSRRAVGRCVADDLSLRDRILEKTGIVDDQQLLASVFGIPESLTKKRGEGQSRKDYIASYEPLIREQAELSRQRFKAYCEKEEIQKDGRYLYMDFVSEGTCQAFLERVLEAELHGYYFLYPYLYAKYVPANTDFFLDAEEADLFLRNYIEMEAVMTSGEPSLSEYGPGGDMIFCEENRSEEEIRQMRYMHEQILAFCCDFLDRFGPRRDISPAFCADLYAVDIPHRIEHQVFDDWTGKEW